MEGDHICERVNCQISHFNPLPPHGGRPISSDPIAATMSFQSTPSAWRETCCHGHRVRCPAGFQSTPSAWRETFDSCRVCQVGMIFQSTPSAWRETRRLCKPNAMFHISIHSLRMEGDQGNSANYRGIMEFQSTPSAWRETSEIVPYARPTLFQSTPSAWRETKTLRNLVSTTAFQSTPSAWRETKFRMLLETLPDISIHSLRMEGDLATRTQLQNATHFNPLPPHGGRLHSI